MQQENDFVWQDREIQFDCAVPSLKLHAGEYEIEALDRCEDTKGSSNEYGRLTVTNLRIMWVYAADKTVNLSVGYDCLRDVSIKSGSTSKYALFLICKFKKSRFEFIFAAHGPDAERAFRTVPQLVKSYQATRLYRNLKLRGALVKNKQLIALPDENIYRMVKGVWNLSADQGNLGVFYITNVRIVWFADLAENFNVSIPYLQVTRVNLHNSDKFGPALVLRTSAASGNFVLGFRIDPASQLKAVYDEIQMLWGVYTKKPNFGVKHKPRTRSESKEVVAKDDLEIVTTTQMEHFESLTRYYADPGKDSDRVPVYDETLGLAVEKPKGEMKVSKLWSIVV